MSINCWFIFQVGARSRKARSEILATCPCEISDSDLDRAIILYEGHRYAEFCELEADERADIVSSCPGDFITSKLIDPRGVCVIPEVGQSFDGKTYKDLVDLEDYLWVACESYQEVGIPAGDLEEAAFDIIMKWAKNNRSTKVAEKIVSLLLTGKSAELAHELEKIPELIHVLPIFLRRSSPLLSEPSLKILGPITQLIPKGAKVKTSEVQIGSPKGRRFARQTGSDFFGGVFKTSFNMADFESENVEIGFTILKYRVPTEEAFTEMKRLLNQSQWEIRDEKINKYMGTFHLFAEHKNRDRVLVYFDVDKGSARIMGLVHTIK